MIIEHRGKRPTIHSTARIGVDRPPEGESLMPQVMPRYAQALARWHNEDREME